MNDIELDKMVSKILIRASFSANLTGFSFLKTAIISVVRDSDKIRNVTKGLYVDIAHTYKANSGSLIERCIRHSITNAFNRNNFKELNFMLNTNFKSKYDKPSNTQFIALVAENIRVGSLRF